jgi:hypothetical protein
VAVGENAWTGIVEQAIEVLVTLEEGGLKLGRR